MWAYDQANTMKRIDLFLQRFFANVPKIQQKEKKCIELSLMTAKACESQARFCDERGGYTSKIERTSRVEQAGGC